MSQDRPDIGLWGWQPRGLMAHRTAKRFRGERGHCPTAGVWYNGIETQNTLVHNGHSKLVSEPASCGVSRWMTFLVLGGRL